jgi:hypothetical protein
VRIEIFAQKKYNQALKTYITYLCYYKWVDIDEVLKDREETEFFCN